MKLKSLTNAELKEYWDEAHRRGLVPLSSIEAESQGTAHSRCYKPPNRQQCTTTIE